MGLAWAEGFAVGALAGWATLMQALPVALPAALVWLTCMLRSRRAAVRAGLLLGLGAGWSVFTAAAGWSTGPWLWIALSLGLLAAGLATTWRILRSRTQGDDRAGPFRHSKVIVGMALIASLLAVGVGLPLRPNEYALSTSIGPAWLGMCGGVGLDAVVRGSQTDPHIAWLENHLGGISRSEATWPLGYRARFTPKLEILDGWGNVVLRDGEAVTESCGGVDSNGGQMMIPPFN
jgi:hypothetical protein